MTTADATLPRIDSPSVALADTAARLGGLARLGHLLTEQIALADAAPHLLSFEPVDTDELDRLDEAIADAIAAIGRFLETHQPQLLAVALERFEHGHALALHVQDEARRAARETPHTPTYST